MGEVELLPLSLTYFTFFRVEVLEETFSVASIEMGFLEDLYRGLLIFSYTTRILSKSTDFLCSLTSFLF